MTGGRKSKGEIGKDKETGKANMPVANRNNQEQLMMSSRMLRKRRDQLVEDFLKGDRSNFLLLHTRILDDYFCETFERSIVGPRIGISKNPYAIVALGGYGREEQCIHSDIDLLLLFKNEVPDVAEDLVREVVYPLWDLGLEIAHATRSLKDCIEMAGKDFDILTPLLDARFIAGMSPLYLELGKQVREKILRKQSGAIISWLVEKNRKRHETFGDSAYLLEPNMKEGRGGLRDYHTMLWISRIKSNVRKRRDLEYFGYLSHDEFQELQESLDFIWSVRNRLHHLMGRKCDQLHFESQIRLAEAMGYGEREDHQPVELFLGDLHARMENIEQQHQVFIHEFEKRGHRRGKRKHPETDVEGLEVKRGMLYFSSPEQILESPRLLIRIFLESGRLRLPLSAEARRLVKDLAHLVDEKFISDPYNIRAFEKILIESTPTFKVLNAMLSTGFLEAFIPEYHGVINRIQYDEYHLYPVDKHMIRAVQTIKRFGSPDDPTHTPFPGKIYKELKEPKLLLWATLLHDIGKGVPEKGHSERGEKMVRKIMKRMGYDDDSADTVAFLVREHLLLVKTGLRRDLNDEETAIVCARKVKDPERLKMLYLLSVGDSIATGPKAWNDWTAILLRDLFLKVLSTLERGELASSQAMELIERKRALVKKLAKTPEEKKRLETLFNFMSPRYLLYAPSEELYSHIELFFERADKSFVWKVTGAPEADTRTVTICAKDMPGLISKIAGVFTLNGIDILDVQVFTWRNNTALDIFKVKPPPDQVFEQERWARAAEHLEAALSGELNLEEALGDKLSERRYTSAVPSVRQSRVKVDNESSSFFTIVEVFTDDFPGLLYRITDALLKARLDIWVAKISTKVDQVVDVFYVRDFDGQKADMPDQEALIEKTVLTALDANGNHDPNNNRQQDRKGDSV